MWSCLRVAQAEMSEYVIQYFKIASIELVIANDICLQGVNRFYHCLDYSDMPKLHFICVVCYLVMQ